MSHIKLCKCGLSFESDHELKDRDQAEHVIENTFECEVCHEKFATFSKRTEHFKIHKEKPCPECGKIIYNTMSWREHRKTFHATSPTTPRPKELKRHMTRQ